MSDDIPLPPVPTTTQAPARPAPAGETQGLKQLAVREAPARLQTPEHPQRLEGRVIAREGDSVRIGTDKGEITVRTSAPLPPETRVIVEVYRERLALLADIAVQKAQHDMEQPPPAKDAPPPLKEGAVVRAILLQDAPPPAIPLPPQKAMEIITALKSARVQSLPPEIPLPVPAETAVKVFQAPETMKTLPPETQQKIAGFLAKPEILSFVKNALPSAQWEALKIPFSPPVTAAAQAPHAAPDIIRQLVAAYLPHMAQERPDAIPPQPSAAPETVENILLQIPRPQDSRPGGETPPQTLAESILRPMAAPPPVLSALLPLVEKIIAAQTPDEGAPEGAQKNTPLLPQWAREAADILPKNMHELRIAQILPPGAPVPAMEALAPGQKTGIVATVTPNGFPMIETAEGENFILKNPARVVTGSTIVFESQPLTPEQVIAEFRPALAGQPAESFAPLADTAWPALQEALAVSMATAQGAAARALQNTLPSPSPRFTPAALFFLAALRMGEVQNWLGQPALDALRQAGKKGLAERLAGDFGKIADQSREPLPGGWKMISMPLLHDEHLTQLRFFVRQQKHDGGGEQGDGEKPATRFLVNLNLSRMGEMQLDGYLHHKQFDMVLRTREKLPFTTRQDIMQRYAAGLEQAHMQGGIRFQTRVEGWVDVGIPRQGLGEG